MINHTAHYNFIVCVLIIEMGYCQKLLHVQRVLRRNAAPKIKLFYLYYHGYQGGCYITINTIKTSSKMNHFNKV